MRRWWLIVLLLAAPAAAATRVSLCDLLADPASKDHQEVELTAFLSHGFEDFTLFDPQCPVDLGVWVEYGGRIRSGTIYCCGVGPERSRLMPLVIDDIYTTLVDDKTFRRFDRLIQQEPDAVVYATMRGHFFAGPGFGHFGLFSLFVIEQVVAVEPHDQRDIDYHAWLDSPSFENGVTFSRRLVEISHPELLAKQREVERRGGDAWRFTEPVRVAREALTKAAGERPGLFLKVVDHQPGRVVLEGTVPGKVNTYRVVVSKPYWLTLYAANRKRIAWQAIALYESGCAEDEKWGAGSAKLPVWPTRRSPISRRCSRR